MIVKLPPDLLEEVFSLSEEGQLADDIVNNAYFALSEDERLRVGELISGGMAPSLAYRAVLLEEMDEETKEYYASVQVGYGLDEIKPLDPSVLLNNPYYQRVMKAFRETRKLGPWTFEVKSYGPYELFVTDDVKVSPNSPLSRYSPLGYFARKVDFPALSKGGRVYMSLIPHELATMESAIKKAHGVVATLGLGMGYFAFMASNKEEVSKVTVLERDEAVIRLFREFFLPLFDHPEKIEVLKVEDALTYAPKAPFDYAFADLHHDAVDGLVPYLTLRHKEGLAKETDVWIEKGILEYLRRHVVALIEEEQDGYGDDAYASYSSDSERVLCSLHFHLKQRHIGAYEELEELLSDEGLKAIAKEMRLR